jgi:hypothetical protein
MNDQIILNSVGSYIETDGMTGPLNDKGLPILDEDSRTHLSDVFIEWFENLSDEDLNTVHWINKTTRGTDELPKNYR